MEALQTVPDPRQRRSSFRIGSVLGITAMALLYIAAEQRENYGSLPALTEALRANPEHAFRLITWRLHG